MSKHLVSLVYRKKIGSMMRKAVLSYMADRANDDGSGVWCSKATIANEIEASRQGVISTIKSLVDDGLLIEDGQRKCSNGFTIEYRIDVKKVHALPFVKGKDLDPSKTGPVKEAYVAPSTTFTPPVNPVDTNLPEPPLEPSIKPDDQFEEAWKLYNSTKLKVGQTKKNAKTQWPKAVKRAGDAQRLLKAISAEVAKRRNPQGFVSHLPDMHRWLRDDRWQDAEREAKPARAAPQASALSDLELAFRRFAETGEWTGDRIGHPFPPNHPSARYAPELYARAALNTQEKAA